VGDDVEIEQRGDLVRVEWSRRGRVPHKPNPMYAYAATLG
jgi:hypothetical protein